MLKFSFPRILHSDNGMEFKSKLMENLSQELGKKNFNLPSSPKQTETRILAQLYQGLHLEIFFRWCP